jgi:hypothetical protein
MLDGFQRLASLSAVNYCGLQFTGPVAAGFYFTWANNRCLRLR